jgi:integrase/recombinase XerD
MTPIAPLITAFLREHMPHQRGYSPLSCESYAHSFKLLFTFAAQRLRVRPSQLMLEHIDAEMVLMFLAHIEQDRGNSPSTRNLRLAAIKAFMRYVEFKCPSALEQIARIHVIPGKRHDQKLIRYLTMAEVRAVLDAPDVATRSGIRDRAMLHLCFAAGLRVSELVGLPLASLTLQPSPGILVRGKGRRERSLPLWKETARDVRAWLAVRGNPSAPELFVNAQGEAMTRAGFEYILAKHGAAAARICPTLAGRTLTPRICYGIVARC